MFFAGSRARGSRIREEGSLLPLRSELNFVGAAITAADNAAAGRTDITVSASGGSGSYPGTVFESTGGDDTAALQAILNGFETAGGGELIISGMCEVTGLRYDGGNLTIRGAYGAGSQRDTAACGFINTTATTTTLDLSHNGVTNADGAATDQGSLIENLRFTADNIMTDGWAIRAGTTFSCSAIRNCTINGGNVVYSPTGGHKNGIYLGEGCQDVHLDQNFLWYLAGVGYEFQGYESGHATAGEGTTYQVTGGIVAMGYYGMKWKHRDAVRCVGVDFVLNAVNVVIQADTAVAQGYGSNHLWGAFVGCTFDSGYVQVIGHASNQIKHIHFDSCIFLSGGLYLSVNTANVRVSNCTFMNGAIVSIAAGCEHTALLGNHFVGLLTAYAVLIASTVCDVEMVGNSVRRVAGSVALASFGGSNDRIILSLNNVRCGASYTASVYTGTPGGSNTVLTGNLAVAV